jgi:hypothetical protein
MMKCKVARELAAQWYKMLDPQDKQAYLAHRKTCAVCKLEFIRECKRMEQDISTYQYNDGVFEDEVTV